MGQEFFINSQELESKVRTLLPSQGGAGAGFDLSASTQIIPVIDLTESAEGSSLREDLQKATDFATTSSLASNATVTAISNTGFYKIYGSGQYRNSTNITVFINDGATTSIIREFDGTTNTDQVFMYNDIVFLRAGDSLQHTTNSTDAYSYIFSRQIAAISGQLNNPLGFSF